MTAAISFGFFSSHSELAHILQEFEGHRLVPLLDEDGAEATGWVINTLHDLERFLPLVRDLEREGLVMSQIVGVHLLVRKIIRGVFILLVTDNEHDILEWLTVEFTLVVASINLITYLVRLRAVTCFSSVLVILRRRRAHVLHHLRVTSAGLIIIIA